ncbi:hypothetical protein [Nocardioides sp.]|uniref:hypothetical protein n=1 Tax=Nocardioides sp. TaxID=35761 RepID=UPI00271EDC19|nr:hypothetical protein [Nocardioides sp.]MDO9455142.1 hypothetical protein [Nocardioides sp.]
MLMRPLRSRRLTLLAAGALVATPLLGGCGFDYATDRVNTISNGANDREGSVDVLGAVIIAGQDNLGLFVATLVNNDLDEPASLQGLEQTDQVTQGADTQPVEIAAGGRESLFQTGGIDVAGEFGAGDFVPVTLTFDTGQTTTVNVNVVTPCRQYSLDKLTELTLPEPQLDPGTGTEAPEEAASEAASEATNELESTSEDAESEADGEPGKYSCEPASPVEHGEPGEEGAGQEADTEASEPAE